MPLSADSCAESDHWIVSDMCCSFGGQKVLCGCPAKPQKLPHLGTCALMHLHFTQLSDNSDLPWEATASLPRNWAVLIVPAVSARRLRFETVILYDLIPTVALDVSPVWKLRQVWRYKRTSRSENLFLAVLSLEFRDFTAFSLTVPFYCLSFRRHENAVNKSMFRAKAAFASREPCAPLGLDPKAIKGNTHYTNAVLWLADPVGAQCCTRCWLYPSVMPWRNFPHATPLSGSACEDIAAN